MAQLPKGGFGAMINQYMGVAPSTFQIYLIRHHLPFVSHLFQSLCPAVPGAPEMLEPNVTSVSDVSESKPSSFDSAAG